GIKRKFIVPRTPHQNGIAERKNRTLIEAARTMLADSLLPILFWAEVDWILCCSDNSSDEVNVAGTIVPTVEQNSSNITNPFSVVGPSNTTDSPTHGKSSFIDASQLSDDPDMPALEDITYSDEENNVGAEADFNNLETSIIASPIPTTKIHKDHPVSQIIGDLSSTTQTRSMTKVVKDQDLCKSFEKLMKDKFQMSSMGELTFFLGLQVKQQKDGIFISQDKYVAEILRKFRLAKEKSASTPINTEKPLLKDPNGEDVDVHTYRSMIGSLMYLTSSRPDIMFADVNSLDADGSLGSARSKQLLPLHPQRLNMLQALVDKKKVVVTKAAIREKQDDKLKKEAKGKSPVESFTGYRDLSAEFEGYSDNSSDEVNVAALEDITYFDEENNVGAEADFNNLETSIIVSPIPTTKIHKDHPISQIIGDLSSTTQTRSMTKVVKDQDLCKSFEKLMKDKFQMSSMGELTFFLGLQVKQQKDGIFISQDKYVAEILRKFRLTKEKSASTPINTEKPLLKDPDGEDVDVHTYRSMIGSLMYLTSSRPDIMFAISQRKATFGLVISKGFTLYLVSYSDSDYAGVSLDRKSTTEGCQFLGCRWISWQCKKQTVVATSSTEAEYVDAASYCARVL
nr:uncharacterized mitochondrial protein AtMg00810-like [Tanacetum cinerariifolium]